MSELLAISHASLSNDLARLEVISNNLANATTPGFRREIAVTPAFDSVLGGLIGAGEGPRLDTTIRVTDQRPGSLQYTGRELDVAIEGDGFLELRGAEGPVYSRMGALAIDATGRLLGASGLPVEGVGGEIQLTGMTPRIDADGSIWENEVEVGRLKLVRFAAPEGLEKIGSGLYRAASLEEPEEDPGLRLRQGHLEMSNVSVMDEMVLMIELVRRFETTQQLVQGYDDVMTQALRTIGDL